MAVMVAMAIVRVMQVPVYQIVDMIAMRNLLVPAIFAVNVQHIVTAAIVRRACGGVGGSHLNYMLVHMISVRAMQMAVMQEIGMIAMFNGRMAASFPMDVGMKLVDLMMVSQVRGSTIRVTPFMTNRRETYRVSGMDCAEEVSLLRRALSGVPGVYELSFDVINAKMTVEFDETRLLAAELSNVVATLGMRLEPWIQVQEAAPSFWKRHGRRVLAGSSAAFLIAGILITASHTGHFSLNLLAHEQGGDPLPLPAVVCLSLAMALGTVPTFGKAMQSIAAFRPDMSALMLLCIVGASVLGEWMEGATVAFLFTLANLLESYSMERARDAISALLGAAPKEATIVHSHGEHKVPVSSVQPGSLIRVRPGETIPFDGDVLQGVSSVNQSFLTGESVPVLKEIGSRVYAGTMNLDGMLDVQTTRMAEDSTLARTLRMVGDSNQRRAQSEQFVERFAAVYTPVVMAAAMLVAVLPPLFFGGQWSSWFYDGMVVLLISCPCALVISTPVTVVAALASAARQGVLIKGGVFLEAAAGVSVLAMDKTGVLTNGSPVVRSVHIFGPYTEEQVLSIAAALEQSSEHAIAEAILDYARTRVLELPIAEQFFADVGRGVEAAVNGQLYWLGSARMAAGQGAAIPEGMGMGVLLGSGSELIAEIILEDVPRKESAAILAELSIPEIIMLTGDHQSVAEKIGRDLGIRSIHAQMLPGEKAQLVRTLMEKGQSVAMVGDGVNDAEAMAASAAGIAVASRRVDLVSESADIVLMSGNIRRLPFLFRHAKRARRIIMENVGIAIAAKIIFLVLVAFGVKTLWLAILADMGATLFVTFNGLRMLRTRE